MSGSAPAASLHFSPSNVFSPSSWGIFFIIVILLFWGWAAYCLAALLHFSPKNIFFPLLHHCRCCRWGWTAYFFWGHKSLLMSSSVICQSNPSKCQKIISNVLFQISNKKQNIFNFSFKLSSKLGLEKWKIGVGLICIFRFLEVYIRRAIWEYYFLSGTRVSVKMASISQSAFYIYISL